MNTRSMLTLARRRFMGRVALWFMVFGGSQIVGFAQDVISNGGFEKELRGWRPFWTRDTNSGGAHLDTSVRHDGRAALRIEHRGQRDWSLEPDARVRVEPGDRFEFEAWLKCDGAPNAALGVSTWNAQGQATDWSFAERRPHADTQWQRARARFVVPLGVVEIQPRLIGYGPGMLWADDFKLTRLGRVQLASPRGSSRPLRLSSPELEVEVNPADASFQVRDKRSGRQWRQNAQQGGVFVRDAHATAESLRFDLLHAADDLEFSAALRLEGNELTVELQGEGEMRVPLRYPFPFLGEAGDYLVIPMNEGISYPVEDESIDLHRLIAYGGHGICMAFFGATDGARGWMGLFETPDDAAIQLNRAEHRLNIAPEWDPQKHRFGYTRKLRYVFFDHGGHVAMAKRYRSHAQSIGWFKTLTEKRRANPDVDLLIGAVNVWCWDKDAVRLARDMQASGIDRILWSNRLSPTNLAALNAMGVLTSRYDIYQDVMNPDHFPKLQWIHPDWTTAAWPHDIILGAQGRFIDGWGVETKAGDMIPCGVICDRRAVQYARERIPTELATHPYRCRFIDTTTAAPWQECHSPDHPMTRTESRRAKMDLLRYVSEDLRLVTGCETGHDAAVPFLHYFEGMLSLGPYRVPDAGRRMQEIWTNVPPDVAKFQLGHAYRLPLWELVYHECVVAQWYWGDYNNKLPTLWDKRDLFNALYGTPPMFMFTRAGWTQNRARFVQSYQNTAPVARKTGYAEMVDHRFLTPDRAVQQTAFANGIVVSVNFGHVAHRLPNGRTLAPGGIDLDERRR